ncbi:uncharacterized protein BYT42DRAFT_492656 [Radiomyces spectabilis]|uniref:uncharacterized protein n=1 Tax=Radiomyces spectabilis TaxID=64574 RepID=UPI00221FA522|nr:uncharacterized protein BYT42DRAFT_492656 [Radiomyces spectabilis]KAI8384476.1 hypothetical protein BYT42DRAFT_492656 [Radiomyces spectabilis]
MKTSHDVVVLGAGVAGLTTALVLKQRGHGVTIVAQSMPGDESTDYASPRAGAHWRTMAPNDNRLLQDFDKCSYEKFLEFGRTMPTDTGVVIVPGIDYYDNAIPETEDPWFKEMVKNFAFIPTNKLPKGAKVGHSYTTGMVNCTGLGARQLGGVQDAAMFPTRGQTLIVQPTTPIRKTITHIGNGFIHYVIPRSDGTVVLGGTSQPNNFDPNPQQETTQKILQETVLLCPELKSCSVLKISVGFRPSRQGGVRIENQYYGKFKDPCIAIIHASYTMISKIDTAKQTKILVTHAYGHGGFGFQSSWGASAYTADLLERGLHSSKL